jgi:hypothetical protein
VSEVFADIPVVADGAGVPVGPGQQLLDTVGRRVA